MERRHTIGRDRVVAFHLVPLEWTLILSLSLTYNQNMLVTTDVWLLMIVETVPLMLQSLLMVRFNG